MRLRNIPTARAELAASSYVIQEADMAGHRGKWAEAFGELRSRAEANPAALDNGLEDDGEGGSEICDHTAAGAAALLHEAAVKVKPVSAKRPLHIEIGMGKGNFLLEMARRNPEIDYIGIEQYSSVLVHPVRRLEQLKQAGTPMTNILLMRVNAELLTDLFAQGEVDRIYLNFSDPWPKDRHAKRRLPGRVFLGRYAAVLSPGGRVEFKTDNRGLFDFALEESKAAGWTLDACTFDLHHDDSLNEGNVMTEYEAKFSAIGNPICKLIEHP